MRSRQLKATPLRKIVSASCTVAVKAGRWTFAEARRLLGLAAAFGFFSSSLLCTGSPK
jgi:hypothetical protein